MNQTKKYCFIAALLATSFLISTFSIAQVQVFTDRAAWETAVNNQFAIEDFNDDAPTAFPNGITAVDDLTFDIVNQQNFVGINDGTGSLTIDGTNYFLGQVDGNPVTTVRMSFPHNVYGWAMDFNELVAGDNLHITFGSDVGEVDVTTFVGGAHSGFVGFVTDHPFDNVLFTDPFISFSSFCIDNVAYTSPPSNDDWTTGTIPITGMDFSVTGHNIGATTQTNEQQIANTGSTVWWFFQASMDGNLTIDTFGSDFDTQLHIFDGFNISPAFENLMPVVDNDDTVDPNNPDNIRQSQVTFEVTAGACYEIRVGGFRGTTAVPGAQGNIVLNGAFSPFMPVPMMIDLDASDAPDLESQAGFIRMTDPAIIGNAFTGTVSPTVNQQGVTVTATQTSTGTNGFRDRGSDPGNTGPFNEVVRDFIFADGAIGQIEVTISGLPAGSYVITSFHFDRLVPLDGNLFDIFVDDANGTGQLKVNNATAHSSQPTYEGERYDVESDGSDITLNFVGSGVRFNGMQITVPIIGDINCDGVINLLDVAPFVDLISNGGFSAKADINGDGIVNLLDVSPFIDLLSGA